MYNFFSPMNPFSGLLFLPFFFYFLKHVNELCVGHTQEEHKKAFEILLHYVLGLCGFDLCGSPFTLYLELVHILALCSNILALCGFWSKS